MFLNDNIRRMQFKIDTKEKIVIFRLEEAGLDAKMAADFEKTVLATPNLETSNLILDLHSLQSAAPEALEAIFTVYQHRYDHGLSAAVSGLNKVLTAQLSEQHPEMLNIVPTESEAIDMVMMEDFERELDSEMNND